MGVEAKFSTQNVVDIILENALKYTTETKMESKIDIENVKITPGEVDVSYSSSNEENSGKVRIKAIANHTSAFGCFKENKITAHIEEGQANAEVEKEKEEATEYSTENIDG